MDKSQQMYLLRVPLGSQCLVQSCNVPLNNLILQDITGSCKTLQDIIYRAVWYLWAPQMR